MIDFNDFVNNNLKYMSESTLNYKRAIIDRTLERSKAFCKSLEFAADEISKELEERKKSKEKEEKVKTLFDKLNSLSKEDLEKLIKNL